MQIYQAGGDVSVQFEITNEIGDPVTPTAVSWRLLNDLEQIIVLDTAVAGPWDSFINIVVPGVNNTLDTGVVVGARLVELTITTANDVIYKRATYGLGTRQRLQILVNSFQTLTQAELEATLVPGLTGWATASEGDKIMAMAEAYRRLTRIGYFVRWPRDPDAQNTISWWNVRNTTIPARFWQFMQLDRYLTYYPEDFRSALRKAQVAEADAILSGDAETEIRNKGIIMEQIGQSKTQFRGTRPLDMGISNRALKFIDGYVNFRLTLTRS